MPRVSPQVSTTVSLKNNNTTKDDDHTTSTHHFSTPPLRPTPSSTKTGLKKKSRKTTATTTTTAITSNNNNNVNMSATRRKISPMHHLDNTTEEDQDYIRFVQSLGEDDPMMAATLQSLLVEEDEEDFVLTDLDDDDDDEEDDELLSSEALPPSSPTSNDNKKTTSTDLPASPLLMEHDFYSELEAELGSLLEEDMEAAVSTLLAGTNTSNKKSSSAKSVAASTTIGAAIPTTPLKKLTTGAPSSSPSSPTTPDATATAASGRQGQMTVTPTQVQRLQNLMSSHYQLLVQSSVLSVRAARKEFPAESPLVFHCGETAEDLTEVLDGAVGMLQDLDQNRKDAIRNYIQRMETAPNAQRSLLPQLKGSTNKRLTRSAFHSLQESTNAQTIFDVDGLYSLKQTFQTIDHCGTKREGLDILEPVQHHEACQVLLEQAGAKIDERLLPGRSDLSQVLCDAREFFGKDFRPPASIPQQIQLRKNRNQFTSAEDNLVLRGVNLYGEKQWILIADRFLPDRSVNIISQRYSKLCLLLYKAHGVKIDEEGNLETPPRFEKVDELDEKAISKLKRASPPAILNVHRWSLEEDVTLLKAVPLLGNQWAELSTRLIPHRDRGHLRKRYQVLERRVKATVTRAKRGDAPSIRTASAAVTGPRIAPYKPPRQQAPRQPRKRKAQPAKSTAPTQPAAKKPAPMNNPVLGTRGPMPAVLLHPANGHHPGRRTMDFQTRTSLSREGEPSRAMNGSHAYANGGFYPGSTGGPNGGGHEHANGQHVDNGAFTNSEFEASPNASRFEKILSETTDDWSQLSRMKRMMENDTESMVASTIVNNLANSVRDAPPLPPPLNGDRGDDERLPDMEAEATSGLSMLHDSTNNIRGNDEAGRQGPATPPKAQNGSILASVLERTRTSNEETKDATTSQENNDRTGVDAHSSSLPMTPSGAPPRYPSSFETPLGVSPGLHMRSIFSPGVLKNGQSPGLKSWGSPGPMHSLMGGGVDSNHEYELYPFELTEASRQALERENAASGKPVGASEPQTPSNPDLFDETHGLKSTDLEAISALNSLSNSPAKFLKKRGLSDDEDDEEAKDDRKGGSQATAKQSLFAAVVGGVEKKESKRKKSRQK